ncbi:MAG: hypothetical protein ACXIT9_03545 [Nitritalea sp.]
MKQVLKGFSGLSYGSYGRFFHAARSLPSFFYGKMWIWLFAGVLLVGCGATHRDREAVAFLEEAWAAHGEVASWERLTRLAFTRQEAYFTTDGQVERNQVTEFNFRNRPEKESSALWLRDEVRHVVQQDRQGLRYSMGENGIENPGFLAQQERFLMQARLWAEGPFALRAEENTKWKYEGEGRPDFLEDTMVGIRVLPEEGDTAASRVYYFHPKSYLLQAVYRKERGEERLLLYSGYVAEGGFFWPEAQEEWVLEAGQRRYLRAAYGYHQYVVN